MLTIKQISDYTGVSKTTVAKYLKAYELEHGKEKDLHITKNEQNTIQISDELAEQVIEAILNKKENRQPPQMVSADVSTNIPPTTANISTNLHKRPPIEDDNHRKLANFDIIIDNLNKTIEMLREQLDRAEQDKDSLKEQLNIKDKQIEQLNILLSQQQQLHQTLQVKLLEIETASEKDETVASQKKKSFLGIFKRKNEKR